MNPWFRARDFLRPIHRTPADTRDAWIHHGFRAWLVLLFALLVPWLFPRDTLPQFEGFEEGRVAPRDVIAEIQFSVVKSPQQIAAEQREAVAGVPSILERNPALADTSIARARRLFAVLDSLVPELERRAAETGDPEDSLAVVLGGIAQVAAASAITFPTRSQLELLAEPGDRAELRRALERAYDGALRRGVIRAGELADVNARNVVIRQEGTRDRVTPLDSIATMEDFYNEAVQEATGALPSAGMPLFNTLLVLFSEPTLRQDSESMRLLREQARRAVQVASGTVLQGERIVAQHELIGEREMERLEAYQAALLEQGLVGVGSGLWRVLGMVLLVAGLLGMIVYTTYSFRPEIYESLRSFSVLLFLILIAVAAGGLIAGTGSHPALVPVAFTALLLAALFDAFLAVVAVSAIAVILLAQPEFEGFAVPMLTLAGGVTAAFAVGEIRRRSQSWRLIALISASYLVTALCLKLIGHFSWGDFLLTTAAGVGNATVCTALAMGAVLPALETFTRRTTEQSLLELADMNRPLLRRLAREAPGTYAHSINMANLVEAACSAIGADSLLARVGVYYHDVGKLIRPQYFIENQPKGLNPHDRLTPKQSAEVLRAHVREGLELAREAKLPHVVQDFIREHHGTQRIRYFFARACEERPDAEIDPNDFCYPGPKPRTKETAIAMLADAVESASRTLAEPSPERVRALIEELVSSRMEEGQLDECGLTFRDLDRVKREFAHVLTGLYHHRIDYPDPVAARLADAETVPGVPVGRLREAGSSRDGDSGPKPPDAAEAEEREGAPLARDARPALREGEAKRRLHLEDPERAEQMTIDLERAAQSDTGPPPVIELPPDRRRSGEESPRRSGE